MKDMIKMDSRKITRWAIASFCLSLFAMLAFTCAFVIDKKVEQKFGQEEIEVLIVGSIASIIMTLTFLSPCLSLAAILLGIMGLTKIHLKTDYNKGIVLCWVGISIGAVVFTLFVITLETSWGIRI